jgi:anti-sigma factor RsiW
MGREIGVLRCRDVTERASALLDGDLPLRGRLALRLHLAMCGMCRTYMDQMRKTRALLARRPLAPPSAAEEDALLARIAAAKDPG